ncbi:hypothetical protein GCM10018963_00250 [Saccharothrix longispora]
MGSRWLKRIVSSVRVFFLVVVDVRGGAVRVLPVGDLEQRARRYRSTRVVPVVAAWMFYA